MSWETTPQIRDFLKSKLDDPKLEVMTEELYTQWMDALKNELKINKSIIKTIKLLIAIRK